MAKLLILDKDGTLTRPKSGAKFVQNPEDQELISGVKEAIARYVADGWSMAIASNQGGCSSINPATGKPFKSIEDAIAEMRYCMSLLPDIKESYFCPDMDGQSCWWVDLTGAREVGLSAKENYRKPGRGMLMLAAFNCLQHEDEILMVGDRPEDEGAAAAAGIPFLHVDRWLDRSPF
jgi:D-glycero-D-manno-heptose 1,7-bisphosphate phosphatase